MSTSWSNFHFPNTWSRNTTCHKAVGASLASQMPDDHLDHTGHTIQLVTLTLQTVNWLKLLNITCCSQSGKCFIVELEIISVSYQPLSVKMHLYVIQNDYIFLRLISIICTMLFLVVASQPLVLLAFAFSHDHLYPKLFIKTNTSTGSWNSSLSFYLYKVNFATAQFGLHGSFPISPSEKNQTGV